ncbi:MAG TPA: hypothetical protein VML56_13725 [Burkholderiales bacterium]|nr:hypothetical protein [Burkholderiales bacterium]
MEYRSKATLLGLPLVHVAVGATVDGRYQRGIAKGWVAVGDIAFGVLFASGGIAIGGITLAGGALGLISIGGVALGLCAAGGLSVGVIALGGAAFGWYAAIGGLAVAHDYAIGGLALARKVIDPNVPGPTSLPSIPHPPFRWSDALVLMGLIAALVVAFLALRGRRKE